MAAPTASSDSTDGPVISLINKRLRALKKKYNRIAQMEEAISQGKTLNKEQEEVLRSKSSLIVLIDELERLRAPLSVAVSEEISLATQHLQASSKQTTLPDLKEGQDDAALPQDASGDAGNTMEDLMNLLYFGSLFDVKSQNEFTSIMLTRTHERGCCLTYDYVTDDATDLLSERDLDLISQLGSMMISRPVDSSLSHKNSLERCIEHAKLWLANSEQSIESNANVSYAALREKLRKIMASDYFTTTPEMKAPVEVAATAGNYVSFQATGVPLGVEGSVGNYQQNEKDASNFEDQEPVYGQNPQEVQQMDDEPRMEETHVQVEHDSHIEAGQEYGNRNYEQQRDSQYVPRRGYQNQRGGGRRGYSNGRRGRGGSYQNGRNNNNYNEQSSENYIPRNYYNSRGRGRRGGSYQNGRNNNNYNEQSSENYIPRNYYNSRGRGRRGGGSNQYNHHGDQQGNNYGYSDVGIES